MVVCDLSAHIPHVKKCKFSPCIRTWNLGEPDTAKLFQSASKVKIMTAAAAVATASVIDADSANHVESAWSKMKNPCWMLPPKFVVSPRTTSGNQKPAGGMKRWKSYTREPRIVLGPQCPERRRHDDRGQEWKTAYIDAKRMAEHAFWLAKSEAEKEEFTTVSPDGDGVFCIAKQMDNRNQDISGENCVCNDAGELVLADENKINAWVEHNSRLLNVELTWSSNELPEVPPITAPTHTPHTPPPPPPPTPSHTHTHTTHTHTHTHTQCICDINPQSIQQNEMQQRCRPFWHRCWDIESCWCGRSWAGERQPQWLFLAAVWSHQTGRRASFWTSIRAKVKPLTVAITVVSNS